MSDMQSSLDERAAHIRAIEARVAALEEDKARLQQALSSARDREAEAERRVADLQSETLLFQSGLSERSQQVSDLRAQVGALERQRSLMSGEGRRGGDPALSDAPTLYQSRGLQLLLCNTSHLTS